MENYNYVVLFIFLCVSYIFYKYVINSEQWIIKMNSDEIDSEIDKIQQKIVKLDQLNESELKEYQDEIMLNSILKVFNLVPDSRIYHTSSDFTKFVNDIYKIMKLVNRVYKINLNQDSLYKKIISTDEDIFIGEFYEIFNVDNNSNSSFFTEMEITIMKDIWRKFNYIPERKDDNRHYNKKLG